MSHFLIKIAKIGLWVFVPVILTSGTKFETSNSKEEVLSEGYLLRTSGKLNQNLTGIVSFERLVKTKRDGNRFSMLKLTLQNTDDGLNHTIQLLISKPKRTGQILKGSYKVLKESQGFINNFDGVFGFADIKALGEIPFFAKSGEININHSNEDRLSGVLKLKMKNASGQSIDIEGDFDTTNIW